MSAWRALREFPAQFEVGHVPRNWVVEDVPAAVVLGARGLAARCAGFGLRKVELLPAEALERIADPTGSTRMWLAWEGAQVTGSFKVRGALYALGEAKKQGHAMVVAASAGNHGAGVAHAARALGLRAMIVVPRTSPRSKVDRMVGPGIEVVRVCGGYDEAEARALEMASTSGARFVSPYDDDYVLAGNGASMAFEVADALGGVPDFALAPIGGGGLATGLALGFDAASGMERRRVWGAQTELSPAFALSWLEGEVRERLEPAGRTLAEGLEGGISRRGAARLARRVAGVSVVQEDAIRRAMRWLHAEVGLRVEGSGAAALAPLLDGIPERMKGGVGVVVLTGSNVDEEVVAAVVGGGGRC